METFVFPDRNRRYTAIIPAHGPYTVIVSPWGVEHYNLLTPGSTLEETEITFVFDETGSLLSYDGSQFSRTSEDFDGKMDEAVALVGLANAASSYGLRWRTDQVRKGRLK